MDLGTLPGFVVPILFGRASGVAGVPALTRHERRSLLRALRRNGSPPHDLAVQRAEADGLEVYEAAIPRRCGACCGRRIYIPPGLSDESAELLIEHERVHWWVGHRGLTHATEADAWLVTADLAWPHTYPRPRGFPAWFLDAAGASRRGAIAKVIAAA